MVLLAPLLSHLDVWVRCLSTLIRSLQLLKLEAYGDLTTTSLTLVYPVRFPDKGFEFSSIPLSKSGWGTRPYASLVSLVSPWPMDCEKVPIFLSGLSSSE